MVVRLSCLAQEAVLAAMVLEQTSICGYLMQERIRSENMRKLLIIITTVFIGLNTGALAGASAFRCGTRLVSAGDFKSRVLAECGEPTHIDVWHEERVYDYYAPYYYNDDFERERHRYRTPVLVKELVTIERWIYNLGNHKLIRYLTFENGRLVLIKTGEHGY